MKSCDLLRRKIVKKIVTIACLSLFLSSLAPASIQAARVIKFATLAPEGSTWIKIMREFDEDVQNATNGEVMALGVKELGLMASENQHPLFFHCPHPRYSDSWQPKKNQKVRILFHQV